MRVNEVRHSSVNQGQYLNGQVVSATIHLQLVAADTKSTSKYLNKQKSRHN